MQDGLAVPALRRASLVDDAAVGLYAVLLDEFFKGGQTREHILTGLDARCAELEGQPNRAQAAAELKVADAAYAKAKREASQAEEKVRKLEVK
eukprot:3670019-Lingulodinium_polyedra.AAC.1